MSGPTAGSGFPHPPAIKVPVAQRQTVLQRSPQRNAGVIQCLTYRHSGTSKNFVISHGTRGASRNPSIEADSSDGLNAYVRYSLFNADQDVVIEHVEAAGTGAGVPRGTGALVLYLLAKEMSDAGKRNFYLGMGARDRVAFWTSMGFNMTTVLTSAQPIPINTLLGNARGRIAGDGWNEYHTFEVEEPKPARKGLCFITTACADSLGLGDDCTELSTLRTFRDTYLLKDPQGTALVKKYYDIAPGIVEAIDSHPDRLQIYAGIYTVVIECVAQIRSGGFDAAVQQYQDMVNHLGELTGQPA